MEGGLGTDRRRLLVLGAGAGQLGLLEAAQERGLYVIAVDRDPSAPGFRHADRRAIVSVEDEPAIDRLATAEAVDGIVAPGIDYPVAIAARIAARHSIPHPLEPSAAQVATSKLKQRLCLAEAGVPHVPYRVCASLTEAAAAGAELGYPVVVKPPDRQGQRGLSLVASERSLAPAFEAAVAEARGGTVLVERLVVGRELTVNAFSVDGAFMPLTVTDRAVAEPPAFGVAVAHIWPSDLPTEITAAAFELAGEAASAIGVRNGPTYTQLLLGGEGLVVGELAARLGGGHDAELCLAATGVDLNGLAISAALGDEIEAGAAAPRTAKVGGACIRFVVAPEGRLESVEGVEEAEAGEGVVWVRVYRREGDELRPLRRGSDRVGAVLAVGGSREEALRRSEGAAGRVRFQTVDAHAIVENR